MSAWQDIFTLESWEILTGKITIKNAKKEDVYIQAQLPKGKGAEECKALISMIGELIHHYHNIPKANIDYFDLRLEMLEKIGGLTAQYISVRGEELQHKNGKKINSVTNIQTTMFAAQSRVVSLQSLKSHNATTCNARRTAHHQDESKSCIMPDGIKRQNSSSILSYESVGVGSMDQWIISLDKRAKKKSAHLTDLKQSIESKIDRDSIIHMITTPHQSGKLFPGVLIEKIDTYHRECEFDPVEINKSNYLTSIPMNKAYHEWLKSESSVPFFIWLEQHPITTLHSVIDMNYEKINVIDYALKDAFIVEIKPSYISEENVLIAKKMTPADNQDNDEFPLTTAKLISGKYAECKKYYFNPAATAYVWDEYDENKFITHPHRAGKYHHSSLVKGADVRCSGMWVVHEGFIEYIDNASGHYRSNPYMLYKLVTFLYERGLVNEMTKVCEITLKGSIKTSGDAMRLQAYFKWARENIPQINEDVIAKLNDGNFDLVNQCRIG